METNHEMIYDDELEQEPISYKFQFRLDRSENKFNCPSCGDKSLSRFIDDNGYYSFSDEGICVNAKCWYQKIPDYHPNGIERYLDTYEEYKKGYYATIDDFHLIVSMQDCLSTNFAKFLNKYLDKDEVYRLVTKYKVGKANPDNYLCDIFWRLDGASNVKNGKVVMFDRREGTVSNIDRKNWVTTYLWGYEYWFNSFFGEHLIDESPEKTIAIVENEMTAIICDYFWPNYTWIAIGGIDEICWELDLYFIECLKNKNVFIFPDSTIPYTKGKISYLEWYNVAQRVINGFHCNLTIGSLLKDLIPGLTKERENNLLKLLRYNQNTDPPSYTSDTCDLPF